MGVFLLFFLVVFLLTLAFLSILNNVRTEKGIDLGNKAGLAVIFSVCLGWILLQISSDVSPVEGSHFLFGFYPFILAAFALSLNAVHKGTGRRFWTILAVTALSVSFLPENLLVFQGLFPILFDRALAAILWALFISGYSTMDKVVGLTFIQTNALCLTFSLVPLIAARDIIMFSADFAFYPLMICIALLAFIVFKRRTPDLLLGRCGAVPLGYFTGLFLIILTAKGWTCVALVMPIYYYFEIIYSRFNILIHHKNPQPKLFTFFISDVIRDNLGSKKILSSLFLFMLGFALTGVLYGKYVYISVTLALCLLLCIIYKLSHWGSRRITYRSMFVDTKDVTVQIWRNFRQSVDEISSAMKKKK